MTLEEYILTYKGLTSSGAEGYICNIPDYYDKVIADLEPKFKQHSLNNERLAICPLHDDHDPSFGLINHRFIKGVKIYHCFGCGSTGTVIRLHQLIQQKYFNRSITDDESCRELADLFQIDISEYDGVSEEDYDAKYMQSMRKLNHLIKDSYTMQDYELEVRQARASQDRGIILDKVNDALVKMVASKKGLYEV